MSKRGQITMFIILAVLVVALVATVFIFWEDLSEKKETVTREYSPLQNYLQDCLEKSMVDVIYINSLQGGYYIVDKPSVVYNDDDIYFDSSIPYYLINQEITLPSKEELENQISYGLKHEFEKSCLDFSEFNYNISYDPEEIYVSSDIRGGFVRVELDSSIYINEEGNSVILDNFTAEKETYYLEYYNFAKSLTEKQKLNGNSICLSCLVEETENKDYDLYLAPVVSHDTYILINTLNNKKDDIVFSFAYKFEK